jgi:hypothetical protein
MHVRSSNQQATAYMEAQNFPFTLKRHNTENLKQIFPKKDGAALSPNFDIHVSVSNLNVLTIGLPILLQENMWTDLGNTEYKLLTDTLMWKD